MVKFRVDRACAGLRRLISRRGESQPGSIQLPQPHPQATPDCWGRTVRPPLDDVRLADSLSLFQNWPVPAGAKSGHLTAGLWLSRSKMAINEVQDRLMR